MSRTNYEAVSDYVRDWLHRAQCLAFDRFFRLVWAWCGPRFQGHPRTVTRTCGNLCRRGVGASTAPTPNHEDKETSPNGRNATPRPKPRSALRNSHWTKAATTYVNMFEGPVTGNIPEVLDNGEVTDGTHVTAGQLALALTPYAQVTDLAVNTAAAGNNAAAIQSLDDRVTAELASKLDSSALAPAIAPLATAAALATTDGQVHGSLQQGRPVGLRRAGGRGGHQEHPGQRGPEAVQLQRP